MRFLQIPDTRAIERIFDINVWKTACLKQNMPRVTNDALHDMIKLCRMCREYLDKQSRIFKTRKLDMISAIGQHAFTIAYVCVTMAQFPPERFIEILTFIRARADLDELSVNEMMAKFGLDDTPSSSKASGSSSKKRSKGKGKGSEVSPVVHLRSIESVNQNVIDDITNEAMSAFYATLSNKKTGANTFKPEVKQHIKEQLLPVMDQRARMLAQLRRVYGENVNSKSWNDRHRFKLEPLRRVAMWLPMKNGMENRSKPHVSMSRENLERFGYHVTKGTAPTMAHYYYDESGRFVGGSDMKDGMSTAIRSKRKVPIDIRSLSQAAQAFFDRRRREMRR